MRNFVDCHATGINMWQQAGFVEHAFGGMRNVVQCGFETHFIQRLSCCRVSELRFFTEREQGFLASHCSALACYFKHLVDRHISLV